eukprot:CAMPEP_0182556508 /NCGR_PEP_ID=MMETSP1324-20130603/752_1 /TAXON_ID=236786 /ORGANISM="Florenciella sp., Strain RCC1587" /LENGTH=63 /DNA_ID=CAMNT_0024768409 /DNA_START=107 /DNA_END=295 /DNA_ORIENTATION=+
MAVYRLKPVPLPPWGNDPGNASIEHEQLVFHVNAVTATTIVIITSMELGMRRRRRYHRHHHHH